MSSAMVLENPELFATDAGRVEYHRAAGKIWITAIHPNEGAHNLAKLWKEAEKFFTERYVGRFEIILYADAQMCPMIFKRKTKWLFKYVAFEYIGGR